ARNRWTAWSTRAVVRDLMRGGLWPRGQPQCAGQIGQRRHQFVRATKHLDRNMIGSGPQMLTQAVGNVVGGAVGDQGVDELVAAGRGEVGVGETQPLEVVYVVCQGVG